MPNTDTYHLYRSLDKLEAAELELATAIKNSDVVPGLALDASGHVAAAVNAIREALGLVKVQKDSRQTDLFEEGAK